MNIIFPFLFISVITNPDIIKWYAVTILKNGMKNGWQLFNVDSNHEILKWKYNLISIKNNIRASARIPEEKKR